MGNIFCNINYYDNNGNGKIIMYLCLFMKLTEIFSENS